MIEVVREDSCMWADRQPEGSVDLIVTDPPYGGIVDTEWDREWDLSMMDNLGLTIARLLKPGGTAYVWGGIGKPGAPRLWFQWLAGVEKMTELKLWDVITWSKKRAYGKKDRLLFTREECAMLVKGEKPATFVVPLLEEKRGYAGWNAKYPAKSEFKRRTNVWTDVTEIMRGKIHECEKPVRLAEIMIETSSNEGELVVDLFAGSGSTGVAAKKLGRRCILVEKSGCVMHSFT